jgi:hypothetical protein
MVVRTAGAGAMTTRELIEAEIEKVPEDRLDELYEVVRGFAASTPASSPAGIVPKLHQVHGPRLAHPEQASDFAKQVSEVSVNAALRQ